MAYKDYAKYAYTAAVPGTYTVTGTYRAGALNKLAISEADNKIEAAQVDCPSTKEGNALTVKTFTLDIKVTTAGSRNPDPYSTGYKQSATAGQTGYRAEKNCR
ncbi:MAG: hypothetical protein ACLVAT_00350 [Lachnospiraceae bacterium]